MEGEIKTHTHLKALPTIETKIHFVTQKNRNYVLNTWL
jgi:hypothetical protein